MTDSDQPFDVLPDQNAKSSLLTNQKKRKRSGNEPNDNPVVDSDRLPNRNDTFCDRCCPLFIDAGESKDHSTEGSLEVGLTIVEIEESANQGCPFCAVVLGMFPALEKAMLAHITRTGEFDVEIENLKIQVRFPSDSAPLKRQPMESPTFRLSCWLPGKRLPEHIDFYDANDFDFNPNIHRSTASITSWQFATEWIDRCLSSHPNCNKPVLPSDTLPTRLIDVGASGNENTVRLCGLESIEHGSRYVTLSHCWGDGDVLKLTSMNMKQLMLSISTADLPKTFQDAIIITRRLRDRYHARYIWIDSLCIIQDCHEDWMKESSRMGHIYSSAFANIAASAAWEGWVGCFQEKVERPIVGCKVHVDCPRLPSGTYWCLPQNLWDTGVDSAPLNTRAWVAQERLLSPRILHFASDQLFFECWETSACEALPEGFNSGIARPRFKQLESGEVPVFFKQPLDICRSSENSNSDFYAKFLSNWNQIIELYSRGELTRPEDKLTALSGVAKVFCQHLDGDDVYLAGLWKQNLSSQLLWRIRDPGSEFQLPVYQAPSWSWASINSPILTEQSDRPGEVTLITILEARTTCMSRDLTGQVSAGFVRLKGRLFRCEIDEKISGPEFLGFLSARLRGAWVMGLPDNTITQRRPAKNMHMLPVKCLTNYEEEDQSIQGLLLEPTYVQKGQFRRFGVFMGYGENAELFSESDDKSSVEHEAFDGTNEYTITIA